jgi:tellurite methyltransferase
VADDPAQPRERWNRRYGGRPPPSQPSTFLTARAELLPAGGRALDLAGGGGRHAIWLARRGFGVTLTDVSDTACRLARQRADAAGVVLDVRRIELGVDPLPSGSFSVVLSHHYLDVEVWRDAVGRLGPGGVALLCQPTVRNLDRHDRPGRSWLLEEGQLEEVVATLDHTEVLELSEGWTDEDRHEARAVLRRPTGP